MTVKEAIERLIANLEILQAQTGMDAKEVIADLESLFETLTEDELNTELQEVK